MSGRPAFEIPEDVLAREVDGEMVLLNLQTEQYYGLDAVGANMVSRLTTSSTTEKALAALLADYEVDEALLRADLDRLSAALVEAGLLRAVGPS